LQRENVVLRFDALLLLEFVAEIVDQALIEILSAEERIRWSTHLELMLAFRPGDLDDGDVEGAPARS